METKTEVAYRTLLKRCQLLFPSLNPVKIMTDYESALQNALRAVYPRAEINGCYFHYVQVNHA